MLADMPTLPAPPTAASGRPWSRCARPRLGIKPQGHHGPAPRAAADCQRHPDGDVGDRHRHAVCALRPSSRAKLPSPSTRSRMSAPVGPTTIRGRRRHLRHFNGFSYLERSQSHHRQKLQDFRRKDARIGFLQRAQGRFLRRVAIIKVTELCLMNLLEYASRG